MRLLLDANLSPRLADLLRGGGIDAEPVRDHGLQRATDADILGFARVGGYVLVSEDTDFGQLLAHNRSTSPSLVLLRSGDPLTPEQQAQLLLHNLDAVGDDVAAGAVIVLEPARVRVRRLPLLPSPGT